MTLIREVNTTPADSLYNDAFGRTRISEPTDRANVEFMLDKSPLAVEEFSAGSGSNATHNATTRDVTLAIGNTTNGTERGLAIKYPVIYTPAHSQDVAITGTLDYAGLGSGTASVFLRSNGADVTTATQSSWTGATNATTVNWKYSQIFGVDFQSLRVGRLRFFMVRAGVPLLVHTISNDNLRPNGYWQYANLRPYWRCYNTGGNFVAEVGYGDSVNGCGFRWTRTANASASMLAVCASVSSEGGENLFDIPGYPFRFSNGATTKTVSTTLIPLASIQVQTTFNALANRTLVIPENISIQTDNPIYVEVRLNPTLTGASFASVDGNSSVFGDVTASAVTGGTVIDADYYGSGGNKGAGARTGLTGRVPMSTNWGATVGDILSVCAVRVGNNNAASGAVVKWKELR